MSELPAEQTWLVLVELLTDLRKKGIEVPKEITKNIQMAKTTINFYKVDPTDPQRQGAVKQINEFLTSAQNSLMELAEELGSEYTKEWLDKLLRASRGEVVYPQKKTDSKFVVGAPSGFSMVRMNLKGPLSEDRVQEIAEYENVIIEFEEDHLLVIYGDKENIIKSLQELSSFFKEQLDEDEP
ncbi:MULTISPECIES: DUF2096 domain-containing protein [Methanobacterium]|jgi:hypothetical protein|uniref:DUF2096 domain-containing protein n=1 Tax=Methanobacterium formicicum TaxID=2162 RepID=A0A090I4R7_METFO|nr:MULTISPECIES: DUF2096 domain-containing protein [Methanobacterium]AIS31311.1 hypothetical protein BRM9_0488 [Methanobacterium formicicum]KUK75286.1 MAG: Uncharacterized protein XD90_0484 [Methanobacterium sp. 42_16]MBF4475550.1 DUF2096 domain-containing protein [Methanobacterium formicicum]MDD4810656.1 DUF2096 domain-containing protein [Methanobacterium formicicum]MDG3547843.1 DUF2096 domain-containing protein [Methanobacterium formicicum]